jgi:hypothetical protein
MYPFFSRVLDCERRAQIYGLNTPRYWRPLLVYTFAHGSIQFPCSISQIGGAFLRLVYQEMEEMQGEVQINVWREALEGGGFEARLGIGRFLVGSDGLPCCLIWIHVADFILHGLSRAKCTSVLKKTLNLTVLVVHPECYQVETPFKTGYGYTWYPIPLNHDPFSLYF